MRGINLTEEFVSQIVGKSATKISESHEGGDHVEAHVCPLCESHLEEPISEEKIQEHVDYFLDVINENFDIVGEELNEEEEVEEEDEEEGDEESDDILESGELGDEEQSEGEDVDETYSSSMAFDPSQGRASKQKRSLTPDEKKAAVAHARIADAQRARTRTARGGGRKA